MNMWLFGDVGEWWIPVLLCSDYVLVIVFMWYYSYRILHR